jgi:hypothetical protein
LADGETLIVADSTAETFGLAAAQLRESQGTYV